MATGEPAYRLPASGRRGGIDTTAHEAFELWLRGASALEISGLLELIDAECKARGWKRIWVANRLGGEIAGAALYPREEG